MAERRLSPRACLADGSGFDPITCRLFMLPRYGEAFG
jgi:hypothetical protein